MSTSPLRQSARRRPTRNAGEKTDEARVSNDKSFFKDAGNVDPEADGNLSQGKDSSQSKKFGQQRDVVRENALDFQQANGRLANRADNNNQAAKKGVRGFSRAKSPIRGVKPTKISRTCKIIRILFKWLILLAALGAIGWGLWHWIENRPLKYVVNPNDVAAEGRIAELERFLKKTTKVLQVQLELVDIKYEKEVGGLKKELEESIEEQAAEFYRDFQNLKAKTSDIEELLLKLKNSEALTRQEVRELVNYVVENRANEDDGQALSLDDVRAVARQSVETDLDFMNLKLVLLVSHELSLSGGPLLLMELAFLLRNAGAQVVWITNQKPDETDEVIYNLEQRMVNRGVQVLPARGQEAVSTALKADMVILNTAVAGKWIDSVLKDNAPHVLPKILWWIHEMRGHYFTLEYVKHLPNVAGAMIDSYTTANYWHNRTRERLGIKMPQTYVVHLGNSKELMEAAEDGVAKRVLREHVRESLGLRNEDLLFAIINSVSRGKGQDLFLHSFYEGLQIIQDQRLQVPSIHAVVVGSDMNAQPKFEKQLRDLVKENRIQDRVHFVNKTLNVIPYLAAVDVLVQNSQARGECFGRITIEAMAFQLPVLGTAAGGTTEIVVNGSTGFLHPVGKEGIKPLAKNIVNLSYHVERRLTMGRKGYVRVKERFMEYHMAERISHVLKDVLKKSKHHA